MKTCPSCGFHHSDADQRCIRCGTFLDRIGEVDPLAPENREVFNYRPGKRKGGRGWLNAPLRLAGVVRRRLYIWRMRLSSPLPEDIHYRNPWISGALSIVPGLGQLYNHQPKKAGIFLLGLLALLTLAGLTFYHPISNYIRVGYLLAALYAFHDGFLTAKRINRDYLVWQHAIAFYLAWIFYVAILSLAAQYFAADMVMKLRYIPYDDIAPFLRRGERIGVDCWTFHFRRPRVGDVVYYNPPMIVMESPGALDSFSDDAVYGGVVVIDPSSAIERVVAGPGQTFEMRDGKFYRDGQAVPPGEQPIIQNQIPSGFKITAPPDSYVILFNYSGSAVDPLAPLTLGMPKDTKVKGSPRTVKVPRMNNPSATVLDSSQGRALSRCNPMFVDNWIVRDWPQGCIVKRRDITGLVRFVYNPPPARRWIR